MTDRRPPPPYASVLYSQLLQLRDEVAMAYRGQGSPDQLATLGRLEARIAVLESGGPGTAWTPVDEVWWRTGAPVLPPGHAEWIALVSEVSP